MITEDQIRAKIIERILAAKGSCNSVQIHHMDGVLRGLAYALLNEDIGTYCSRDCPAFLAKVGIITSREGEEYQIDQVQYDELRRKFPEILTEV